MIKSFLFTISRLLLVEMVKRFGYQTISAPVHFLELPKHVLNWYISEIQFGAKLAIGLPLLPLVDTGPSLLPIGRATGGRFSPAVLSWNSGEPVSESPNPPADLELPKSSDLILNWFHIKVFNIMFWTHSHSLRNFWKFVSVPICWSDLLWKFWTSNFALIWWNDLLWNPWISILDIFSRSLLAQMTPTSFQWTKILSNPWKTPKIHQNFQTFAKI